MLYEMIGLLASRIAFDPGDDVYVNIIEKSFVISCATEIAFILSTRVLKEKHIKSKLSKACTVFEVRNMKYQFGFVWPAIEIEF